MVLFCLHSLLAPPSITPTSAYYLWDFPPVFISFSSVWRLLLFYSLPSPILLSGFASISHYRNLIPASLLLHRRQTAGSLVGGRILGCCFMQHLGVNQCCSSCKDGEGHLASVELLTFTLPVGYIFLASLQLFAFYWSSK